MSPKQYFSCHTICFFEVRFFWQLWPVGCAGCTVFGCLWQTSLCWNFGHNFFAQTNAQNKLS